MKLKNLIYRIAFAVLLASGTWAVTSCNSFDEDLPECRLFVSFKYDYNMLFTDAFHTQVDKIELYVFDRDGKFLFKQMEEGATLATGNYRMEVELPVGEYRLMAWAGVRESYDVTPLTPGVSTLTDLRLRLKREETLLIEHKLEPLWYGEINHVSFTGTTHQTEVINLIKDTNKIRFIFQGYSDDDWGLNIDDYNYEVQESNGHLGYDNSLLEDDVLSFHPYYRQQVSPSAATVELNTMRLMADRQTRFMVTEKATGKKVFNINLIDYIGMTNMEGYNMSAQEYLDRQDEYRIVFFFSDSWHAVQIQINGWTYYIQPEEEM